VAEAASDPALAAVAHLRIGEILDVTGSTEDARARFSKTLELLAASPEDALRVVREAETYLRIAHAFRREGALDRAELAVGEATARYRRLEHDEGLAGVLYEGAVIAMFQNRAEIALARFDEGLVIARRAGARTIAAALTTARGGLLQEMRRFDEALVHHADAAGVFRELGSRYREASALYYLGTAYLDTGDPKEADRFFAQALECGRAVGAPRYEALMQGGRAIALDMLGDCATSREAFASAERAQAACRTEGALAATLAIHRLTLGLPKDPMSRAAAEASAHALADAHPSDDSRFALRMCLGALNPETRGTPASLVVYDRGRAFRLPRARQITDLSHRVPLRAILRLLAEKRALMPGATVSVEDIICAGWPGESIDVEAAMNRVYVALAALRRLGLRELLVTGAGGYMLSPAVGIALVAEPLEALEPPS
jgi:tetratricopeptide (TPR) repeat protein